VTDREELAERNLLLVGWVSRLTRLAAIVAAMAAASLYVGGCGGTEEGDGGDGGGEVVTVTGLTEDASAVIITIDADLNVLPPIVSVSKAAETKIQWHNESEQDVFITFPGTPVRLILPAGAYSHTWQVSSEASETVQEYQVASVLGGPAGSPSVDVGP
jgi:hypothetical protein